MFSVKRIFRFSALAVGLVILFFVGKSRLAEFYYNRGNDCYQRQSYKEAAIYFDKALKMYPSSAVVSYALANAYRDGGAEDKAIEGYKRTLRLDGRFIEAYRALANLYFQRESYQKVLDLLKNVGAVIPNDPTLMTLKKRASLEYSLNAAMRSFERKDGFGARESLKTALDVDPDSAPAHYMLASSFYEQRDYYQAEEHLKEAIRLNPRFNFAYILLGDIYFERGDLEKAIEQYKASLAIHGADPEVLNSLGLTYMRLERYGSAIPYLQKALSFDPSRVSINYNLSAVYRDYGMLDKAAEGFIRVMSLQPDYPNVHNDLGDIYKRQKREEEALREYRATIASCEKKLSRSPSDPFVLVELAYAYNEIKEHDKAMGLVEKAIIINPRDSQAYLTQASIYRNLNRPDAALEALNKANQLSPRQYSFIGDAIVAAHEHLVKQKQ